MNRKFIPWALLLLVLVDSIFNRIIQGYGEGFKGNIVTWVIIFIGVVLLIIYFKTGVNNNEEK